ncbi:MAG: hypothetical protein EA361_03110 [Bacteroidetes bacterium]|nr:MAG: hypothetical protein EA361_03110 [Bacteroidota bacterium]
MFWGHGGGQMSKGSFTIDKAGAPSMIPVRIAIAVMEEIKPAQYIESIGSSIPVKASVYG